MKIKVKLFAGGQMPQVNEKGDLFDVFAREEVSLISPQAGVQHQVNNIKVRDVEFKHALIPLGFAMEIPEGFKLICILEALHIRNGRLSLLTQ